MQHNSYYNYINNNTVQYKILDNTLVQIGLYVSLLFGKFTLKEKSLINLRDIQLFKDVCQLFSRFMSLYNFDDEPTVLHEWFFSDDSIMNEVVNILSKVLN